MSDLTVVEQSEMRDYSDNVGTIHTEVDDATHTLVNVTHPDHKFHPGTVTRHVYVSNGQVLIETIGDGDGQFPGINQIAGPGVFRAIDAVIMQRVGSNP